MAWGDRHASQVVLSALVRERAMRTQTNLRYDDCPDLKVLADQIVADLMESRHPFMEPDDDTMPFTVILPDGVLGYATSEAKPFIGLA